MLTIEGRHYSWQYGWRCALRLLEKPQARTPPSTAAAARRERLPSCAGSGSQNGRHPWFFRQVVFCNDASHALDTTAKVYPGGHLPNEVDDRTLSISWALTGGRGVQKYDVGCTPLNLRTGALQAVCCSWMRPGATLQWLHSPLLCWQLHPELAKQSASPA